MKDITNNIYEDEIDLKELFKTIWEKKIFIIIFTLIITILSGIYIYIKKPIYEAKALLELGHYKTGVNTKTYLLSSKELNKKLNILFIDIDKENTKYEKINILKGFNAFIEVEVNDESNDAAIKKINELIKFISKKEEEIYDRRFEDIKLKINKLDLKLKDVKNLEVKNLEVKINIQEKTIISVKNQLKSLEKALENVKTNDYAVFLLKQNEKKILEEKIRTINLNLLDLTQSLINLRTNKIIQIEEEKRVLEKNLLENNNMKVKVVGKIITNDYPIKPKKKLILVISFVTGFILSIFLVFFIQFIKNFKEEKLSND